MAEVNFAKEAVVWPIGVLLMLPPVIVAPDDEKVLAVKVEATSRVDWRVKAPPMLAVPETTRDVELAAPLV